MKQTGSKDLKFIPHKVINQNDAMDVPFRIVGHKLRWVAGRKSEDSFTRPWRILKKSDLPQEVIRDLESRSINVFRDGETVRFGENVLAYATDEAAGQAAKAVRDETRALRESIGMDSSNRPGVKIDQKETSVGRIGATDFE